MEETKNVIDIFFPKYKNTDLYGSIVFGGTEDSKGKLELNDWVELAKSINIDFCACYDPGYPNNMKLVRSCEKTMLIVSFDCESG